MYTLSFDVGIVNLAYCIFDPVGYKIKNWEIIALENTRDHADLYINLIKQLDNRSQLLTDISTVLIEKQPSFNPKMRIIAGCLQSYFFIRGVVDKTPETRIKVIKFFSPKNKLKCYSGPEISIIGKSKSKYSQTKKMGIAICEKKLEEHNEPLEIKDLFHNSRKKDDLADCYLQVLTYSMFGNYLSREPKPKCKNIVKVTKKELKDSIKTFMESYLPPMDILEYMNTYPQKDDIITLYGTRLENMDQLKIFLKKLNMVNLSKRKFYI